MTYNYYDNNIYSYNSSVNFKDNHYSISIMYPKFMDFISFSIKFICGKNFDNIELSFYERNIYEFRTSGLIKYVLRYYKPNGRVIKILSQLTL